MASLIIKGRINEVLLQVNRVLKHKHDTSSVLIKLNRRKDSLTATMAGVRTTQHTIQ